MQKKLLDVYKRQTQRIIKLEVAGEQDDAMIQEVRSFIDGLRNGCLLYTSGNSGIGKATAILFAKEGADLVLCARRKEALDEVAEECRQYGVQVVTVKADVSSHCLLYTSWRKATGRK